MVSLSYKITKMTMGAMMSKKAAASGFTNGWRKIAVG
jgi:hypothetical protein